MRDILLGALAFVVWQLIRTWRRRYGCGAEREGYFCTLPFWHRGDHVAEDTRGLVASRWTRAGDVVIDRWDERSPPLVKLRAGAPDQFIEVPDGPLYFAGAPMKSKLGRAMVEITAAFEREHGRPMLLSESPSYDELKAYVALKDATP